MGRRILAVALMAMAVAITVFGIPLAVAAQVIITSEERSELERVALRASLDVPADLAATADPVELPPASADMQVGAYDGSGRRLAGSGPVRADPVTHAALGGEIVDGTADSSVVVAVPVSADEHVVAVVRAASPESTVRGHVALAWASLAGLALLASSCAALLARWQAARLAEPVQRLGAAAQELGAGNFAVRVPPSGVREIDRASASLNETARQLNQLVERERDFATHASHQLRTPLTVIRLGLEEALRRGGAGLPGAVTAALEQIGRLNATITDLLALRRHARLQAHTVDLPALLDGVEVRWHAILAAEGRPLRIGLAEAPPAFASEAAVRQVLDVLVENARRHGTGPIRVEIREAAGAAAIDVVDDGPRTPDRASDRGAQTPPYPGTGVGLDLARSLLESDDGRLLLRVTPTRTVATVLLRVDDGTEYPPARSGQ